jgi:hypothetical protein
MVLLDAIVFNEFPFEHAFHDVWMPRHVGHERSEDGDHFVQRCIAWEYKLHTASLAEDLDLYFSFVLHGGGVGCGLSLRKMSS